MILRIHHAQVPIPPGAEPQAREFYCGVLGLDEVEKPEPLRSRGGFWLAVGDQQIHIGADPNPQPANSKAHVAYEVEDLVAWRAELKSHGLSCKDGERIPGFIRAETRDPFGNRIEFLQRINDRGEV